MSIKTQDIFASADSFMHAGTKGMLWGVRHWQNEDGTLTEEGRERYNAFRRKDGSTGYYMNEKGLKEYNEELKDLTETMTKIDAFEKKTVQPVIKNIANDKEATQLGLENAPNHARIEAMSTEDIKKEIERRTAINTLRGLTDKKKSSNYEKTMRAVALVGGITTAAISGVKLYGEIGHLINESRIKEAASALSHAGVKGMKRGYHLFGDYEYTPIGTPAQEEKNLNKISRAKTAEDIKNYQNRQKNVRIDDNAEARAIRRRQDIKNKIKEQEIADNYNRRKQTQQDRYEHYNKRTSDKEAYKLEKKRLDDVAKRQKDMANTNAKNALNMEREKQRLSQETTKKELQAETERQRQQTKNQLQLNRSVAKTASKTQKRTIRFEEEKIKLAKKEALDKAKAAASEQKIKEKQIKADQEAKERQIKADQEAEKQRQEYNKQLADQQVEQERQIENDKKKSRTKAIVIGAAIAAVGALAIKSYMASKGAQTPSAPSGQLNPPNKIDSTHLLGAPSKNYKKPIVNDTMKMKVSSVKAGASPIERVDQSRVVHEPYTRIDQTRQLAAPGENSRTYAAKGKYIGKVAVNRFDANKSFEKTTAKPAIIDKTRQLAAPATVYPVKPLQSTPAKPAIVDQTRQLAAPATVKPVTPQQSTPATSQNDQNRKTFMDQQKAMLKNSMTRMRIVNEGAKPDASPEAIRDANAIRLQMLDHNIGVRMPDRADFGGTNSILDRSKMARAERIATTMPDYARLQVSRLDENGSPTRIRLDRIAKARYDDLAMHKVRENAERVLPKDELTRMENSNMTKRVLEYWRGLPKG